MRTAGWTDSVTVLDRVTAVFDAFGECDDGLGVSELARRANLPKSTVSRIASDLVAQRFLDREGDKLYLGVRLFELAQTVERPRRIRRLAHPVITQLRDATGHTATLAVLDGSDVVVLATVRAEGGCLPPAAIGGRLPAAATALGKAMLAFSPAGFVDRIVGDSPASATSRIKPEGAALSRELADVRRRRVATDTGGGTGCMSAAGAILDRGGVPVAAISVTAPAPEVPDRIAAAVCTAATALSRRLDAVDHG